MKKDDVRWLALAFCAVLSLSAFSSAFAQFVPGGTLDPTTIPKYVTPLVIPPAMPTSTTSPAPVADYDIAVRQFKQQILPGGLWDVLSGRTDNMPATTVWSYGRAEDPAPDISGLIPTLPAGVAPAPNSTFNYPAFTIENTTMITTNVRWINDLVDGAGNYLPHLFSVDQTMHWANPPKADCSMMPANRTDCETHLAAPYTGPVPFVTHLHGAHVQPHSDGYPEAWWLPAANNIPAGYALRGSNFGQADNSNTVPGSAFFSYENTQAATTLWYHDHALGMTRLNVYAGPAGFWLIRGGSFDTAAGVLPGPAPSVGGGDPNFNAAVRAAIREIPIAIQDRSFNTDGSLFYPADRSFFDGFTGPYIGGTGTPTGPSDISGIWNPEAFFNTMVVNGTTWPKFEVAPARYRLRLLNGCNSRTLNLAMFTVVSLGTDSTPGTADDALGAPEISFYQIGAEQGFLPNVVKIQTGQFTVLPGDGSLGTPVSAPSSTQALLMMPAERADVIVDFSGMPDGTRIRMINTAPDGPFGGFADPPADPLTSGQVMDFIVNSLLSQPTDTASTPVENLVLPVEAALGVATVTRQLSLNELMSDQVCVEIDGTSGAIVGTLFSRPAGDPTFMADCLAATPTIPGNFGDLMGPRQAQLGVLATVGGNLTAVPLKWSAPVTETPSLNSIELWEIYNTTVDAHPIHLHLVGFEVVDRQDFDPLTLLSVGTATAPNPNELGYKDTVVALPGQITRIKARFDISGLYVWHCHIVEHEDNEMMRPMCVKNADGSIQRDCQPSFGQLDKIGVYRGNGVWYLDVNGNGAWDGPVMDKQYSFGGGVTGAVSVRGDWTGTGSSNIGIFANGIWYLDLNGNGAYDGTPTDARFSFGGGVSGAVPVVGDWTGTGTSKVGIFANGVWYLDLNGNGAYDGTPTDARLSFGGGVAGAVPVAGDWTGSGRTKIGIFANGVWYLDQSGNGAWDNTPTDAKLTYTGGVVGGIPVTGDWARTGITNIGVYKDGQWYLDQSGNGVWDGAPTDSVYTFGVGQVGAIPMAGIWNSPVM